MVPVNDFWLCYGERDDPHEPGLCFNVRLAEFKAVPLHIGSLSYFASQGRRGMIEFSSVWKATVDVVS